MKLELSEDNMQAFLIFQDEDLANPIDKAAIVKLLHEMDITEFNLNEGWQDAYEKFQQKVLEENQYLIAEGTPEHIASIAKSYTGQFLGPMLREENYQLA